MLPREENRERFSLPAASLSILFEVKNRRLSEARFWERAVAVGLVCKGFIVEVVDLGVDKEAGSHEALLGSCLEGPSDFEGGLRNLSPLFSGWFFGPGTL